MVNTIRDGIEHICTYGKFGKCARLGAFLFNEKNLDYNVRDRYVLDVVTKFTKTDSLNNNQLGKPRILNDEAQIEVLGSFVKEPTSFIRSVSKQTRMSHETLRKPLKMIFKGYHIPLLAG